MNYTQELLEKAYNISTILCLDANTNCRGFKLKTVVPENLLNCYAECVYNVFCIFYVYMEEKQMCNLYSLIYYRYNQKNSILGDISCGKELLKNQRAYYSELFIYFNSYEFIGTFIAQLLSFIYIIYFVLRIKDLEFSSITYPSEYIAILADLFQNSLFMYEYQIIIVYESYQYDLVFILWTVTVILIILFRVYIVYKQYYSISDSIQRKINLNYDIVMGFLCVIFGLSLLKITLTGVKHEDKKDIFLYSSFTYLLFIGLDIFTLLYLPFVFQFIRLIPFILDLSIFSFNLIYYILIKFFHIYDIASTHGDSDSSFSLPSFVTAVSS